MLEEFLCGTDSSDVQDGVDEASIQVSPLCHVSHRGHSDSVGMERLLSTKKEGTIEVKRGGGCREDSESVAIIHEC
jgi:hypothetical protein